MLDECKGEKFEEAIAAFSTTVLHKVLAADQATKPSVARQLVLAHDLSAEEQRSLLPLAIAHRVSLTRVLQKKAYLRARYREFQRLLDDKEHELRGRADDLQRVSENNDEKSNSGGQIDEVKNHIFTHWQGDPRWIEVILGEGDKPHDPLLDLPFPKVWANVTHGAAENVVHRQPGLLQGLERRVKEQEERLQKWKKFREDLAVTTISTAKGGDSSNNPKPAQGLDLDFTRHSNLILGKIRLQDLPPDRESVSNIVVEYERLVKTMRGELAYIDEAMQRPRDGPGQLQDSQRITTEAYGLLSVAPVSSVGFQVGKISEGLVVANADTMNAPTKLLTRSKLPRLPTLANKSIRNINNGQATSSTVSIAMPKLEVNQKSQLSVQGHLLKADLKSKQPISIPETVEPDIDEEENLAQAIIFSAMNAPSPINPKLSLSERARKSMALVSAEETRATMQPPPPSPSRKPQPLDIPASFSPETTLNRRETLLERTRQSMSLLPPKPRIPPAPDKRRSSKIYPANQFGTPEKSGRLSMTGPTHSTPPETLFGHDANYASVFKSRPKIAMSPTLSPMPDGAAPDGLDDVVEEHLGEGGVEFDGEHQHDAGSSPLARVRSAVGRF